MGITTHLIVCVGTKGGNAYRYYYCLWPFYFSSYRPLHCFLKLPPWARCSSVPILPAMFSVTLALFLILLCSHGQSTRFSPQPVFPLSPFISLCRHLLHLCLQVWLLWTSDQRFLALVTWLPTLLKHSVLTAKVIASKPVFPSWLPDFC